MAQKTTLGKGLASLLGEANTESISSRMGPGQIGVSEETAQIEPTKERVLGITMLPVDQIRVNNFQPRKVFDSDSIQELAQSVRTNGIIQPLIIRKSAEGTYELIAGERRLRAAKLAGLKQVPVVFRTSTNKESLEIALVENIQRENLNCVDEALAFSQLINDFHFSVEQVSARVGKAVATVQNTMRVLGLPPTILQDVRDSVLSLGHAKAILAVESVEDRIYLRNQICEKKLSVREAEEMSHQMKKQKSSQGLHKRPRSHAAFSAQYLKLAQDLTRSLGVKVEIKGSEKKGAICLHYQDQQDLNRLLDGLYVAPAGEK